MEGDRLVFLELVRHVAHKSERFFLPVTVCEVNPLVPMAIIADELSANAFENFYEWISSNFIDTRLNSARTLIEICQNKDILRQLCKSHKVQDILNILLHSDNFRSICCGMHILADILEVSQDPNQWHHSIKLATKFIGYDTKGVEWGQVCRQFERILKFTEK